MFLYLLGIILFLCVLHILLNYNDKARLLRKIPGPKEHFIVGNGLTIMRSPVEIMKMGRNYANTWKRIYKLRAGTLGSVVIYNPEDIEIIMSNSKFNDKSFIYQFLKPWLRDGLLISNGTKWQERRKILTPTFHFNILKQFCEVLVENSQRLVEKLVYTAGQPIDVAPVLSEFTLNSICETAMGTQLNEEDTSAGDSYKHAIHQMASVMYERLVRIYLYPDVIYYSTKLGKKQNELLKTVHAFTAKVIKQRKEYMKENGINGDHHTNDHEGTNVKKRKTAMLDLLISAEIEGQIDKDGVLEEVDTFMFEGHDTTASGLTFCLMLLANHKNIQEKILVELLEIFGYSKRPVKMEDLPNMRYMECCIKESMRLHPPVHFISRNLNEKTVLSNYTIPAGTLCHIPIYDLHHCPDLYENPEQFNPDRFLPENSIGRHPYAYIPFSAGPRNCIGQKFAMMEMKVAIAEILRHFELVPVTRPEDIVHIADLVLRNDGPVLVNFVNRY